MYIYVYIYVYICVWCDLAIQEKTLCVCVSVCDWRKAGSLLSNTNHAKCLLYMYKLH